MYRFLSQTNNSDRGQLYFTHKRNTFKFVIFRCIFIFDAFDSKLKETSNDVTLKIKILERFIMQPQVSVEKHEYEAVNYHIFLLYEAGTTLFLLPVTVFAPAL